MNSYTRFLSVIALSACAMAGLGRAEPESSIPHKSLEIIRTVEPVFPFRATEVTSSGTAVVAINVDAEGQLVDSLVLSYTRKEFADEALRSVKEWKYVPASYGGEPVSVVTELEFQFSATGVVVSQSFMQNIERVMNPLLRDRVEYAPCGLKEIDRIPMPINVVSPSYPAALAAKGVKGDVVIVFYIDEQGRVRMPAIQEATDMALAERAIAAISQWKFEPPTRHGTPVLVRASQVFTFTPPSSAKAITQ